MLETQPLSEPLEPLPDMQCDDSELSVAGEEQESHSEDREFGLHHLCHMHSVTNPPAEARSHKPTGSLTAIWATLKPQETKHSKEL